MVFPTTHRDAWVWRSKSLIAVVLAVCSGMGPPASAEESTTVEKRLNVILISLDTVRPDHLSCYGYHRQTTPHIDQIAKEGVLFTQAFSQALETLPSHLSLFTSRYPTEAWIAWEAADLEPSTETLTEVLKRHGYRTAGFTNLARHPLVHSLLTTSRAFQPFDRLVGDVWLRALPEALFEWLQTHRDQPFFLFLHGYDAHNPHVLPIQYDAKRFNRGYQGGLPSTNAELDALLESSLAIDDLRVLHGKARFYKERKKRELLLKQLGAPDRVQPEDLDHLKALYDAQLYYLDQGLGELFQALENLELMERTILVVLSDHGQAFGEHGMYMTHDRSYDEVTRMVLLVRDPRLRRRGRKIHSVVQGIDVMPTILELVDLPIPPSAEGRSLVSLLQTGRDLGREEVAVSVGPGLRAIRTPTWKLIATAEGTGELYHVAMDPREQRNLITQHPDIAAQLQHRLDAVMPAEVAGEGVVDPDQWMQEHGYW